MSNSANRRTEVVPESAPDVASVIYVGKFPAKPRPVTSKREEELPRVPARTIRMCLIAASLIVIGAVAVLQFGAVRNVLDKLMITPNPVVAPQHQSSERHPDVALGLSLDPIIAVQTPAHVPLGIAIRASGDALPKSFLYLSGLPPVVGLSAGRIIGPGEWIVPAVAARDLAMDVPDGVSGSFQILITLLAGGERTQVLTTHATTTLVVTSATPKEQLPGYVGAPRDRDDNQTDTSEVKRHIENPIVADRESALDPSSDRPTERTGARTSDSNRFPIASGSEGPLATVSPPTRLPNSGVDLVPREVAPAKAEERARAEKFIARGERDLEDGNIALARLLFRRAAEVGIARGAFLLASTYDPSELVRLGTMGIQPDRTLARKWYERALMLGEPEAKERLARLTDN